MLQIPNYPYKILINCGTASGKTNALLDLISYQRDIDEIYLYAKYKLKQNINC